MASFGMFLHPKIPVGVSLERVHGLFKKVLPLMGAIQVGHPGINASLHSEWLWQECGLHPGKGSLRPRDLAGHGSEGLSE